MSPFFGLEPHHKALAQLEPCFFLMHYLGFSYSDVMSLPLQVRRWFCERISKHLDESAKRGQSDSRAAEMNTPEMRAMRGKSATQVPARRRHSDA